MLAMSWRRSWGRPRKESCETALHYPRGYWSLPLCDCSARGEMDLVADMAWSGFHGDLGCLCNQSSRCLWKAFGWDNTLVESGRVLSLFSDVGSRVESQPLGVSRACCERDLEGTGGGKASGWRGACARVRELRGFNC